VFLEYIGILVVLGFAFRLLSALLGLPFAALLMLLHRYQGPDATARSLAVNHAFQCVAYAVLLALMTALYATDRGVTHTWAYATLGFLWTYLMLGSNAHEKGRATSDPLGMMQTREEAAVREGAGLGLGIGLILFIVVYNWPAVVTFIPGVPLFIEWTIRVADWLVGFWIVRIVLGFTVLGYVLNFGFMILVGGALLLGAAWSGAKRVLGPRPAA
jgi:hypothetical protein